MLDYKNIIIKRYALSLSGSEIARQLADDVVLPVLAETGGQRGVLQAELVDGCMLGADYAVNTKEHFVLPIDGKLNGVSPSVIIEAVGSVPTYQMAIEQVAFTGRVVCIGYAKSEVLMQTRFFVQKELDIRGSRNALPEDFEAVIRYLERGTCPVDKLITKVIKPDEGLETLRWWSQNPGKVFRILMEM